MSLSPDVSYHMGGMEVFTGTDEHIADLNDIDEYIMENKDWGQEARPRSHLPGPGPSPSVHLPGPSAHLSGPGDRLNCPSAHLIDPSDRLNGPSSAFLRGPSAHLPGPSAHLPGPSDHGTGSHLPGPGSRLPGPPPPPAELRCDRLRLALDSHVSPKPVLVSRGTAPRAPCSITFPPPSHPGEMASAPPCRGASPSGPSWHTCAPPTSSSCSSSISASASSSISSSSSSSAVRPCSGTEQLESLLEAPRLAVVEQPKERGMRFRYECEGRSAGSILGASSTGTTKIQPAVEIQGSIDKVKMVTVTVSLVTKDMPHRPHPHCLVGKDCPDGSGICMVRFNPHVSPQHSFANLGIQCVRRKELDASLQKRRSQNIDPFITGQSKSIEDMDMNVVRLCFQGDLEMEDGQKESLSPVVSNPIYDKKATTTSQLKISCLNITRGACSGRTEIYMLCDKVQKDDIEIIFKAGSWEGKGEFAQTDVHRQIAIVFKTPPYREQDITEELPVDVVLRRISDRMDSEPVSFTFLPNNPDPYEVNRKRKIKPDIGIAEQACVAAGPSSHSMAMKPPGTHASFPVLPGTDGMGAAAAAAAAAHPDPSALGEAAFGDPQDLDMLFDQDLISKLLDMPSIGALLFEPDFIPAALHQGAAANSSNYGNTEGMSGGGGGGGGGGGFVSYGQDFSHYNDMYFSNMVNDSQSDAPPAQGPDPPQGLEARQVQVKTEEDL